MGPLNKLEDKLNPVLTKDAPFQLPENAKKWIVEYSPIISAVIGVLGLLAAMSLWRAAHLVNDLVDFSNALSKAYGTKETVAKLGVSFYLSFAALLASSIIPIVAYPGLKAKSKKRGWDLLFISAIISLIYGVALAIYDTSVFSLISKLLGSVISLYFLFQIRSYYLPGKKAETAKPKSESKK